MTSRVVRGQRTGGFSRVQGTCGVTDVMDTPDPRASTALQQTERAGSEPAPRKSPHHNIFEGETIMTNTISDLDLINADLTGPARNAFGREAKPGDQLTGELVEVERRHRHDGEGNPLYWVDRKPSRIEAGRPVIDNVLIWQTDLQDDEEDDGRRLLRLDQDVKKALNVAMAEAGVKTLAFGARIEGFLYVGPAENGKGRVYDGGTFIPPAA